MRPVLRHPQLPDATPRRTGCGDRSGRRCQAPACRPTPLAQTTKPPFSSSSRRGASCRRAWGGRRRERRCSRCARPGKITRSARTTRQQRRPAGAEVGKGGVGETLASVSSAYEQRRTETVTLVQATAWFAPRETPSMFRPRDTITGFSRTLRAPPPASPCGWGGVGG